MITTQDPQVFAAAAPDDDDRDDTGAALSPSEREHDDHLHELCEQLAQWSRTRRLFGSPKLPPSILGQLGKRTRPLRDAPDAECAADLAALWVAVQIFPLDQLDRQIFELHYLHRVTNIKNASAALGIGRQHWYTLLREFRRKAYIASHAILFANESAAARLPNFLPK